MSKYIISTKKVLDDGSEEQFCFNTDKAEIECNSFCLLGFTGSGNLKDAPTACQVVLEGVNRMMLSAAIYANKILRDSAALARAVGELISRHKEDDDAAN